MDYTNLMNAIYRTLSQGGADLLNNPKSFTSSLFDLIEGEVPNQRYLYDLFQNGMLKYFAKNFRSTNEVETAAKQAYKSVCDNNSHLNRDWVWNICEAMAYALESYYNLNVKQMENPDKDAEKKATVVSTPPQTQMPPQMQSPPRNYPPQEYYQPVPHESKPKNNAVVWAILAAAALIAVVVLLTRPIIANQEPAVTVTVEPSVTFTPEDTETPTPTPTPTPASNTSGYLLPDSATRLLTESDLAPLTHEELCFARNEIFARHGRQFTTREVANYFNRQSWYHETVPADQFDEDRQLSTIERKNVAFIFDYETKHYGGSYY